MSNLLQVVRFKPQESTKKGNVPIILEFEVHPDTAPYLVTSSSGLIWVEEPHPGNILKAAIQEISSPGHLFWAMALSVILRGKRDEWGNVHPFSENGVLDAVKHLEDYDLTDIEILVPRVREDKNENGVYKRPSWLHPDILGYPLRPTSWVPDDCAIVVPRNRDYVGMMTHITLKKVAAATHNPSRSIAVAWDGHNELAE